MKEEGKRAQQKRTKYEGTCNSNVLSINFGFGKDYSRNTRNIT